MTRNPDRYVHVEMAGWHNDLVQVTINRYFPIKADPAVRNPPVRYRTVTHTYNAGNRSQGRLERLNLHWSAQFCDNISLVAWSQKGNPMS